MREKASVRVSSFHGMDWALTLLWRKSVSASQYRFALNLCLPFKLSPICPLITTLITPSWVVIAGPKSKKRRWYLLPVSPLSSQLSPWASLIKAGKGLSLSPLTFSLSLTPLSLGGLEECEERREKAVAKCGWQPIMVGNLLARIFESLVRIHVRSVFLWSWHIPPLSPQSQYWGRKEADCWLSPKIILKTELAYFPPLPR